MSDWIDTHCHLDAPEFGAEIGAIRERALRYGVRHCVIPAVEVANFDTVRALAHQFGDSYALTLRHWRQRFMARREQARALGLDERFLRMWEFYLCYCEGGFIEHAISDVQLLLAAPGNARPQYLPGI